MALLTHTPLKRFVCHPYILDIHKSISPQAELEHRNPKSRYARTSKKGFLKQLTQIDRRQARIRRLREELVRANKLPQEALASDPEAPYNIGKSQNHSVDLTQFLQANTDDPATKVLFIFRKRYHRCLSVIHRVS
jgi:hypothetical protein